LMADLEAKIKVQSSLAQALEIQIYWLLDEPTNDLILRLLNG
jgi:ATPase subunit of ABC transporter with duplicated ATPase domains